MMLGNAFRWYREILEDVTEGVDPRCSNPRCGAENDWALALIKHGTFTYRCCACGSLYVTQKNAIGDWNEAISSVVRWRAR